MPTWLVVVLAVLAPGGVITVLIERTRRENNRDHANNANLLRQIDRKVDKIDDRLFEHITHHDDK